MNLFQLTDPHTAAVAKLKKKMVVLWPIKQIIGYGILKIVFVLEIFATLLLQEKLIP